MEIIRLDNVSFKYKTYDSGGSQSITKDEDFAVKDLSFSINEGEFVAFIGRNGSGKSTCAKLLNGLLTPASGDVLFFGDGNAQGANTKIKSQLFDIRKNIGMAFQNPDNQTIATIVEDDIAFGPENIGIPSAEISERVDFALKSVGMEQYRHSAASRLSGGQKQGVAIAVVLALKPKVLVLDESTAMLDPRGRTEIMDVITKLNKEQGITIILITHFMEEAARADRVLVFNEGQIVLAGSPSEIFTQREKLKDIGLSVPFATEISAILKEKGLDASGNALDFEGLYEEVCRLSQKS